MQADAADLIRDASLNDRVELRVLGDVGAKIRVLEVDSPGVEVSSEFPILASIFARSRDPNLGVAWVNFLILALLTAMFLFMSIYL